MENEKKSSKKVKKVVFWVSLAIFLLGLIFIAKTNELVYYE